MANTRAVTQAAKPAAVTISEGTRQELAMNGYAVSPFTGAMLVGSGSHDVRVADKDEYKAAVKANAEKRAAGRNVERL